MYKNTVPTRHNLSPQQTPKANSKLFCVWSGSAFIRVVNPADPHTLGSLYPRVFFYFSQIKYIVVSHELSSKLPVYNIAQFSVVPPFGRPSSHCEIWGKLREWDQRHKPSFSWSVNPIQKDPSHGTDAIQTWLKYLNSNNNINLFVVFSWRLSAQHSYGCHVCPYD